MTMDELWRVAAAAVWGLAVGVLNNRLVADVLARMRAGFDPRAPEGRALLRRWARRHLLRLPVGMGALLVVFWLWRDAGPLLATALGMVATQAAAVVSELRSRPGSGKEVDEA